MLEHKTLKQMLDDYEDSFALAKHLNIRVSYFEFIDTIYGYYTPMLSTPHIIINKSLSLEEQERVCDHMIAHHILHPGVPFCLDHSAFKELEQKQNFSHYVFLHRKMLSFG